jgi:hypothetical protein
VFRRYFDEKTSPHSGWPLHSNCCDFDSWSGREPCDPGIDHGKTKGLECTPFILIFVAILLAFISLINMSSSVLNDHIPLRIYLVIERILIVGIVLGVVGMFQPWLMIFYKIGFMVLLVSTLGFIWWSHVKPKRERRQKETVSPSIQEI